VARDEEREIGARCYVLSPGAFASERSLALLLLPEKDASALIALCPKEVMAHDIAAQLNARDAWASEPADEPYKQWAAEKKAVVDEPPQPYPAHATKEDLSREMLKVAEALDYAIWALDDNETRYTSIAAIHSILLHKR
jgi:hypothetical protein